MSKKRGLRSESLLKLAITSGMLIAVLAGLLRAQAIAYRQAYLGFFGLDFNQFPLGEGALHNVVINAWSSASVTMLEGVFPIWLKLVRDTWWLGLAVVLGVSIVSLCGKHLLSRRAAQGGMARSEVSPPTLRRGLLVDAPPAINAATGLIVWLLSTFVLPLFLFLGSLLVVTFIAVSIIPFYVLGRSQAHEFCTKPVERHTWVAYRLPSQDRSLEGVVIECNENYCAVLRDGGVEVFRAEHMERMYQDSEMKDGIPPGVRCPGNEGDERGMS
jgi:hypothetical protein